MPNIINLPSNQVKEVIKTVAPTSFTFYGYRDSTLDLRCIDMKYFGTQASTDFTDMVQIPTCKYMFSNTMLEELDLDPLDMSNITDTTAMFKNSGGLKHITGFLSTQNVINMSEMFYNCSALIDIPSFDMSNVSNAENMFTGCSSLSSDTLMTISGMLYGATSLQQKSLSYVGFDSTQISTIKQMGWDQLQQAGWTE